MSEDKIIAADDAILQERAKLLAELCDITTAADKITALREENARLREVLIGVLAGFVASVDLLERGGKKAAPSDKMFAQMLVDYKNRIERGRAAVAAIRNSRNCVPEGGTNE